jgi:phosphoribosylanthranilate isomerase
MTLVKVCGITRYEDAELALELGADALGFIFAASPRRIAPDAARSLVARLGERAMRLGTVGVFVGAHASADWPLAQPFLRALQAHGEESPEFLGGLTGITRIKVFRIADSEDLAGIESYASAADYFMLDTKVNGVAGGTGRAFDWGLLEGRTFSRPIILAGGLTPQNVGDAIRRVRPFAVDAASCTEASPGKKDPSKLKEFFAAAREAGGT